MANKTYKDVTIKVDNAAGTLTAITGDVTSASVTGSQTNLSDAGFGDAEDTILAGLASGTFTIAGFINTTTEAIFAPLVGNQTTLAKTVEYASGTGKKLFGEYLPTNVQISGAVNALQTWSADFQLNGATTYNTTGAS